MPLIIKVETCMLRPSVASLLGGNRPFDNVFNAQKSVVFTNHLTVSFLVSPFFRYIYILKFVTYFITDRHCNLMLLTL